VDKRGFSGSDSEARCHAPGGSGCSSARALSAARRSWVGGLKLPVEGRTCSVDLNSVKGPDWGWTRNLADAEAVAGSTQGTGHRSAR